MTDKTDYIPRQAVIDLLYYYADEACSAVAGDVERMPGILHDRLDLTIDANPKT